MKVIIDHYWVYNKINFNSWFYNKPNNHFLNDLLWNGNLKTNEKFVFNRMLYFVISKFCRLCQKKYAEHWTNLKQEILVFLFRYIFEENFTKNRAKCAKNNKHCSTSE